MTLGGQSLRFLIVGGIATATDALLFATLTSLGTDARASNLLSYPLSAILAFALHRCWTFAAREGAIGAQAARFAVMVGLGLALSTAIVWLLAPAIGALPAKVVAIGATLVLNFTASRWLVFAPVGGGGVVRARAA